MVIKPKQITQYKLSAKACYGKRSEIWTLLQINTAAHSPSSHGIAHYIFTLEIFHRATASASVRRVVGWGIQQNTRPHLSARRCVEKHQQARQAPRARRSSTTSPTTPTTPPPPHPTTWYPLAIRCLSTRCFRLLGLLGSVFDLGIVRFGL
jgi:hypothetical protein